MMRSVISQVYHHGGRSIGSRRNFSSSLGFAGSVVPGFVGKCLAVAGGYFIGYFAFNGYPLKLEEMHQESKREYEQSLMQFEEFAGKLKLEKQERMRKHGETMRMYEELSRELNLENHSEKSRENGEA